MTNRGMLSGAIPWAVALSLTGVIFSTPEAKAWCLFNCGKSSSRHSQAPSTKGKGTGKGPLFNRACVHKDSGGFQFGNAPTACDATPYGDSHRIENFYTPVVFDKSKKDTDTERKRYVTELYALIKGMAAEYIKRRDPDVTQSEIDGWTRAILSLATQESFLSQYRVGDDGRKKFMTGDHGKSFGMMQINQEFHAVRGRDTGFDLVTNITMGMDILYSGYAQAKKASCIRSTKKNKVTGDMVVTAGLRSAYSMYNGGGGEKCRWTNRKDSWYQNDKGYFQKYQDRPWEKYVSDLKAETSIKFKCLMDKDEACAVSTPVDRPSTAPKRGQIIALEDGRTCLFTNDKELSCADDARTFTCLSLKNGGVDSEVEHYLMKTVDPLYKDITIKNVTGRALVCSEALDHLVQIGGMIRTTRQASLRDDIDGPELTKVPAGKVLQVLDYEFKQEEKFETFYHVRIQDGKNTREGWISAGASGDRNSAVEEFKGDASKAEKFIPLVGQNVEVVKAEGMVLLSDLTSKSPMNVTVPNGTVLQAEKVWIVEGDNQIYLKVNYQGQSGFIYAGLTYPFLTVSEWVKVK